MLNGCGLGAATSMTPRMARELKGPGSIRRADPVGPSYFEPAVHRYEPPHEPLLPEMTSLSEVVWE